MNIKISALDGMHMNIKGIEPTCKLLLIGLKYTFRQNSFP